jgi:hypothetical protein
MSRKTVFVALFFSMLVQTVAALATPPPVGNYDATVATTICTILKDIRDTIYAAGQALVVVMFTYGGVRYVFSADDPGGRKSAKMTCVHAIIGGILLAIAVTTIDTIGLWQGCT